ncbi:unnamed protein product [Prunus brigantina]
MSMPAWVHKELEFVSGRAMSITIDAHQPVRGPTRGDKLWRIPPKLNLLSCPTGRATKGIDPWKLEKKLANHARGTEDGNLNDPPCEQMMTIDAHQLARGPTRGNKLPRNPHKLNLLICPTGRAPKGIDSWGPRKKSASRARGTEDVDTGLQPCEQRTTEEALCKEIDRVDCSPFTDEVERAPPPKRFTTPSITAFKGDSDPESHLRHFKSTIILYKADDTLIATHFGTMIESPQRKLASKLTTRRSGQAKRATSSSKKPEISADRGPKREAQKQGPSLIPTIVDTPIIGFQKKDLIGLDLPHNDALVIYIQIEQAVIERVHVDEGSAANILQLSVIQQMGFEPKISKLARSLTGFNGATSITVGTIDLDVHSPPMVCSQTFMVIDEVSPYNGILGRPWISKIEAITSAQHQKIRYPIPGGGIGQINSDQAMARRCTTQGLKKSKQLQFTPQLRNQDQGEGIRPEDSPEKGWKPEDDVELVPPDPGKPDKEAQIGSYQNPNKKDRDERIRPEGSLEEGWKPEEDVELVPLDPDQPDKKARIGSRLSPDEKMELTIFLQNNKDMFAWSPSDMPGIDPNIICHRLHVNPTLKASSW